MSTEGKLREIIAEVTDGFDAKGLGLNAPFLDAGLDSLDMARVLLEVQEVFGVIVPEGEEDKYDTLGKLVAFVEQNKNG